LSRRSISLSRRLRDRCAASIVCIVRVSRIVSIPIGYHAIVPSKRINGRSYGAPATIDLLVLRVVSHKHVDVLRSLDDGVNIITIILSIVQILVEVIDLHLKISNAFGRIIAARRGTAQKMTIESVLELIDLRVEASHEISDLALVSTLCIGKACGSKDQKQYCSDRG